MSRPNTLPRTLSAQTRFVAAVLQTMQAWAFRRKSRLCLSRLAAHHLRDIGIDPLTAHAECAKPFWRD
ncbi:MAG: DUF1127 domain-containing protein [Paracoccaceae bacterium]